MVVNFKHVDKQIEEMQKVCEAKVSRRDLTKVQSSVQETRDHADRKFFDAKALNLKLEDDLIMLQRLVQRLQLEGKDR